ncbi:MAG: hypothetical protein ABSF09_11595 [Candidatus Bathyarchaeia archaeon]|jgi:hypothetical protein
MLDVPVPTYEKLVNMFYEIEEGKRKMSPQNLNELDAYMKQVGCILPT